MPRIKKELLEKLIRECVGELLTQTTSNKDSIVKERINKSSTSHLKSNVLEYVIKECVIDILNEIIPGAEDTQGAPAPPAGGLGTGDQPALVQSKNKELPNTGIILVNPKDKASLQEVPLKDKNDSGVERDLFKIGSAIAGPNIKVSLNAMKMVKDGITNPSTPVYIFIGKYDTESSELFVMADRDLTVARDSSVPASELTGGSSVSGGINKSNSKEAVLAEFRTAIKTLVKEMIKKNVTRKKTT